jgi:hypothetical protein
MQFSAVWISDSPLCNCSNRLKARRGTYDDPFDNELDEFLFAVGQDGWRPHVAHMLLFMTIIDERKKEATSDRVCLKHGGGAAFGKIKIDDLAARESRAQSSDGAAAKESRGTR